MVLTSLSVLLNDDTTSRLSSTFLDKLDLKQHFKKMIRFVEILNLWVKRFCVLITSSRPSWT